jgi:hypothetical protein
MWEVMENPLTHAESKSPAWFQATAYKRHVNFVVVDSGVGILTSLRTGHPGIKDDVEAIRLAAEFGVTRSREIGQGNGLGGCRAITQHNRGLFIIWSGVGSLEVSTAGKGEPVTERGPTEVVHQGTIVELQLNTDVPIDNLPRLLGHRHMVTMAELDGLRPSGDSTLFRVVDEIEGFGSRQHGRALRNKVLNIWDAARDLPITLDFAGVPMVSSSFADEAIGKLAAEVGGDVFSRSFQLTGASNTVRSLLAAAIERRVGEG